MSMIDISSPTPAFVETVPQNDVDRFQETVHFYGQEFTRSNARIESSNKQGFALGDIANPAQNLLIEHGFRYRECRGG
jgi:hypothetical protein